MDPREKMPSGKQKPKSGKEAHTPYSDERRKRAIELLPRRTSKKLLKYLIENCNQEILTEFDQEPRERGDDTGTVEDLKNDLQKLGVLSSGSLLIVTRLYPRLIANVPAPESVENIYGDLARDAGCTGEEIQEAIEILGLFNNKAIEFAFKQIQKNTEKEEAMKKQQKAEEVKRREEKKKK